MKVSLSMPYSTFVEQGGYWYAAKNITDSLERLGVEVSFNDPSADVMFNFCQPQDYASHKGQYTIGYTPWESTGMQGPAFGANAPGLEGLGIGYDNGMSRLSWPEQINSKVDEFWTTNSLGLQWFQDGGVDIPSKVFPHGIEPVWTPAERFTSGPLTFLHIGEPAPRKCGQMVFDAFKELFGNDPDYRLIIKATSYCGVRDFDGAGMIRRPDELIKNVEIITGNYPINDLVGLYHRANALVYPSWGEGFGFIPLQAMATGMPVIMNESWADYRDLAVGLTVEERLIESPWQDIHPGSMMEPSFESLKDQMLKFASNTDNYTKRAFANAETVHKVYNWDNTVRKAFKDFM